MPEPNRIEVVLHQDDDRADTLEVIVDRDLSGFEEFFKGLGNDSLAGPERAAIKTYLWWKTHQENQDG